MGCPGCVLYLATRWSIYSIICPSRVQLQAYGSFAHGEPSRHFLNSTQCFTIFQGEYITWCRKKYNTKQPVECKCIDTWANKIDNYRSCTRTIIFAFSQPAFHLIWTSSRAPSSLFDCHPSRRPNLWDLRRDASCQLEGWVVRMGLEIIKVLYLHCAAFFSKASQSSPSSLLPSSS